MDRKQHLKIEQNYLLACAAAIFTAFLCINLYPDYHGGPQIGRSGLLALSAAMIAMMIFIVKKAVFERRDDDSVEGTPQTSSPERLKRMFFLWSGFTVLLSASLVRYPLYLYYKEHQPLDTKGYVSLIVGIALTLATVGHVVYRLKDYRKL